MAVAEWFFLRGRAENGPFTLDQIHSYFSTGSINEETYLWRPGCTDWFPLAAFEEFAPYLPEPVDYAEPQYDDELRAEPQALAAAPNEQPLPAHARQWVDEAPHPWRRYFARYLDYLVWFVALMLLLRFGPASLNEQMLRPFSVMFEGQGGQMIAVVIAVVLGFVLAVIANAILIGLTGGNLGKWLFGVRVLDESDRPIGLVRSLKREGRVLLIGLGLGIPILSLVTLILSYLKLKGEGATNWDQALALRVVHRKTGLAQYIGYMAGLVLIIGLFGLIGWLQGIGADLTNS